MEKQSIERYFWMLSFRQRISSEEHHRWRHHVHSDKSPISNSPLFSITFNRRIWLGDQSIWKLRDIKSFVWRGRRANWVKKWQISLTWICRKKFGWILALLEAVVSSTQFESSQDHFAIRVFLVLWIRIFSLDWNQIKKESAASPTWRRNACLFVSIRATHQSYLLSKASSTIALKNLNVENKINPNLYFLPKVCREIFQISWVCREWKKVENHCSSNSSSTLPYWGYIAQSAVNSARHGKLKF